MALMFGAFMLLVIVSTGLTFWGLNAQKEDTRIINLAGRQRMLIQQMTSLALEYQQEGEPHYKAELMDAASEFDGTLLALHSGSGMVDYLGRSVSMPPPENSLLAKELDEMSLGWTEFKARLGLLAGPPSDTSRAAIQDIASLAPQLVAQADIIFRAYEDLSAAKINQLHWFQWGSLLSGIGLFCLVWRMSRLSIIHPLDLLKQSSRRIGDGDLETPVKVSGPVEIQILGDTIDTMRAQLQNSRQELNQWVDTLENRVSQRTQELEALSAVSKDITSHLNINEVLKSVTEKARQLLGSEVAMLCLLDTQGLALNLHAAAGPDTAALKNSALIHDPATLQALTGKMAVPCGLQTCPGFCEILDPRFRASHLASPLRSGEQIIGALCVGDSRPGRFRPESAPILTQLVDAAAVAMENSRLYQQAEHGAALKERQQIASEMHDGLLQTLSFQRWMVGLSTEQLSQGDIPKALLTLSQIERASDQAENEIRKAIASLQEDFAVRYTLQVLLAEMIAEAVARQSAPPDKAAAVRWENQVSQPVLLPRSESDQVLRVVREVLLNAQRHSRADTITVRFERTANGLSLSVIDNGIGFSTQKSIEEDSPGGKRLHFGLKIMQARAARLGGSLEIESAPGLGTRVSLRWSPASM